MAAVAGGGPPPEIAAAPAAVAGPEFLLLPEPEGGVLNHGGPDNVNVVVEGVGNLVDDKAAKVLKVR
jgi:hypothetical protein